MVMPSPGVMMPTMRSPGTAPPLGAKRTGRSRIDAADRDRRAVLAVSGTLNFTALARLSPNQPLSAFGAARGDALVLVVGIHGAHDVGGFHLAAADRRHHVVDRGARKPRQRAFELLVGIGDLGALAEPFEDAPAEPGILVAHGGAGRAADRGARLAGDDDGFPRRRRRGLRLRGQDLHLVAVLQRRDQRRRSCR